MTCDPEVPVAALDSIRLVCGDCTLGRHPLIQCFLKGAASLSPPQIHRFPTWKLEVVLHALTKSPFEPLQDVGLKRVRLKTIFLVVITSARRISELEALACHPNWCTFHEDKVVLHVDPSFIPKVSLRFHRDPGGLPSFLLSTPTSPTGNQMAFIRRMQSPEVFPCQDKGPQAIRLTYLLQTWA